MFKFVKDIKGNCRHFFPDTVHNVQLRSSTTNKLIFTYCSFAG